MKQRFYSLDVFRGATVAFMILVNNPGSWSHLYSPLKHADWHGLTPTDLVFPFFLFAVGNAMAFVMPRLRAAGDGVFWKKVLTRTALIFLIGLFLNWFPFVQWQNNELLFRGWTWQNEDGTVRGVRILGVLQRIALCYLFASIIVYYLRPRSAAIAGASLLIFYWILCILGNPADPYSLQGWFGTSVDLAIIGDAHLYHGEGVAFEPEGLVSTIPSIVQVIIGFLAGDFLRKKTSMDASLASGVATKTAATSTAAASANVYPALASSPSASPAPMASAPSIAADSGTPASSSASAPASSVQQGPGMQAVHASSASNAGVTHDSGSSIPDSAGNASVVSSNLYHVLTVLFVSAVVLMFAGYAWGLSFPINKKIWTSSYVLLTCGLAISLLCVFIYFIEVKKSRGGWTRFFDVFGKNPLFIYALSGLIPKLLFIIRIPAGTDADGSPMYTSPWTWYYRNVTSNFPGPPENGSLLFALSFVFLLWAIAWWMDKKKVYVRV